ncbi:MAG TPA: hypothetical protein VH418_00690 [Solirubrobacteraceae bacterium]|jgi:hypothetical protein
MFDPLYKETRVHPHLTAAANAARYADLRADAERRRALPRASRARHLWRGRRAAWNQMRARAA